MALYQERLRRGTSGVVDATELRRADSAERALRLAAVAAERECIYGLVRQREISDELARRLVRDLDLMEARYR